MKKRRLVLACILAFSCIFGQIPVMATDEKAEAALPNVSETENDKSSVENSPILEEEIGKRESHIKYFLHEDGQYSATIYDSPVHYQKDGKWEDIDNRLRQAPLLFSSALQSKRLSKEPVAYWENTANDFHVQLPSELYDDTPVLISQNGYSLAFAMQNVQMTQAQAIQPVTDAISNQQLQSKMMDAVNEKERIQIANEEKIALNKLTAEIRYEQVRPDMHLTYELRGKTLKESLVFERIPTQSSFTFAMQYENLTAVLEDDNSVSFIASDTEKSIFTILPPYMFDSEDGYSSQVEVQLEPTEYGCLYTLTPDAAWLAAPERVYPVTLDPSVESSQDAKLIEDNGVNEDTPNTNYMTSNRMYVGSWKNGSNVYENRIYIRLPLPTQIASSDIITSAALQMRFYNTASYQTADKSKLHVYKVSNDWISSSITWKSQEKYTFGSPVSLTEVNKGDAITNFDITSLAREWYTGTKNNGLVIKPVAKDTAKTNRTCYISSDSPVSDLKLRPKAIINYRSPYGQTAGIDNGASYYIRSVHSGLYLDANADPNSPNFKNVMQYNFHGNKNHQWRVSYQQDGYYKLYSQFTGFNGGHCLDIADLTSNNVDVYPDGTGDWLLFRILPNGDGSYRIMNKWGGNTTKVLDVYGWSTDSGGNVFQSDWHGGNNQRWIFEKVNFGSAYSYDTLKNNNPHANCAGFALNIDKFLSGSIINVNFGDNVDTVANRLKEYINKNYPSRSIRIVGKNLYPTYSINSNEYRIALRTRSSPYDYHFYVQTNTGEWAHKPGSASCEPLGYINPTAVSWKGGYNSDTVYLAVSR